MRKIRKDRLQRETAEFRKEVNNPNLKYSVAERESRFVDTGGGRER